MPKVFGLHEVELPSGVTPEEFERGYGKELASWPDYEGWKTTSAWKHAHATPNRARSPETCGNRRYAGCGK